MPGYCFIVCWPFLYTARNVIFVASSIGPHSYVQNGKDIWTFCSQWLLFRGALHWFCYFLFVSGILGLELARAGPLWSGRNDSLHIFSYKLQSICCWTFTGLQSHDTWKFLCVYNVLNSYIASSVLFTGNNHISGCLYSTRYSKNGWSCCTSLSYIILGAYHCSLCS